MHNIIYYTGALVYFVGGITLLILLLVACLDLWLRKYSSTRDVATYVANRRHYQREAIRFSLMKDYIEQDYYSLQGTEDLPSINKARDLLGLPAITQEQMDTIDDWDAFDNPPK